MNANTKDETSQLVRQAKDVMRERKPIANTFVIRKLGNGNASFEGSIGGAKVDGTVGVNGVTTTARVEAKTGQVLSNAQEAEAFN